MSTSEDQPVDTYTDLTARLAAADLGWSHEHGDPPANPDYIKRLAFQVMAFKPPLIAGVYVDDEMLDDMRDGLHGDNCGCGEWDSHSQEYVERMDETIHAVLYPLRHPVRPVLQGTEDSDYREQIARALVPGGDQSTFGRVLDVVAPLVEQLRQARAAYNRMAGHSVDRAAERDRYYLAWQSAARGRRRARVERDTARNQFLDHYNGTAGQLDRIRELQDALRERTGQRDEARAERELARESRDQYHKNWDAAVAANMTALDTIGGLRADLETRTRERDHYRDQSEQRAADVRTLLWLHAEAVWLWQRAEADETRAHRALAAVGRAIECFLGVEYGTPVESARALVERCADAERALDGLRTTAVIATFRRAAEPVREQVEGAAPPEVEITDEHVREHDDAAPNRDKVVEAWADTWDGVDRTSEWVRVVEPCPVPDCTIPQVHGHEGYGLRFTPAAQPEPQGEPDEDWCGRFADDGKHYCPEGHNTVYQMFSGGREWYCADCGTQGTYPPAPADVGPRARLLTQSGGAAELKRQMDEHLASPGTGQWGARWPGSAWVTNLGEAQARIEVERHAKAGAVLVWRESKDHDWAEVASPGTGTEAGE